MHKSSKQTSSEQTNKKNIETDLYFINPWTIVKQWYQSDLGQELFKIEKKCLKKQLEKIFGYNLIQLGCLGAAGTANSGADRLIYDSKISYKFVFESLSDSRQCSLNCDFSALPVKNNSIDAIVLPHTLEFESDPHQILREVERVLMAEGKAIFFVFNPYSLWGLLHKYWQIKRRIKTNQSVQTQMPLPSCGQLISQKRLKDWLQLLGFDIELVKGYFFRPPLQNSSLLKNIQFIEKTGEMSGFIPAGAYMIVATKRVSTLTPIRQPWRLSPRLMGTQASTTQQSSSAFKAVDFKNSQIKSTDRQSSKGIVLTQQRKDKGNNNK